MNNESDNKKLLLRYLMGEISGTEQSRLEVRYMSDQALFDELVLTEEELMDGYARGEFSERERKRIEKYFLKSRIRRENLLFIRLLIDYSARHPLPV